MSFLVDYHKGFNRGAQIEGVYHGYGSDLPPPNELIPTQCVHCLLSGTFIPWHQRQTAIVMSLADDPPVVEPTMIFESQGKRWWRKRKRTPSHTVMAVCAAADPRTDAVWFRTGGPFGWPDDQAWTQIGEPVTHWKLTVADTVHVWKLVDRRWNGFQLGVWCD